MRVECGYCLKKFKEGEYYIPRLKIKKLIPPELGVDLIPKFINRNYKGICIDCAMNIIKGVPKIKRK